MLIGLVVAREFIYGLIYFVLLGIMLLGLWIVERWKGLGQRIILLIGLVMLFLLFDNIIIPDLKNLIRYRYLALALLLILLLKREFVSNFTVYFLGLNLIYIISAFTYSLFLKDVRIYPDAGPGKVRSRINEWALSEENIVVIMLDGYPSERILQQNFGITPAIRKQFPFLKYQENISSYLESPMSVCNQLFTIKFEKGRETLDRASNILKLFADAKSISGIEDNLRSYAQHWISYLNEKAIYEKTITYWRIYPFRSFLRTELQYRLKYKVEMSQIDLYNNWVLEKVKSNMWINEKPQFVFIYFLTFHNFNNPIAQELDNANSYLSQALKAVPNGYKVIVFSDHGIRESNWERRDQVSGIFYYGEKQP